MKSKKSITVRFYESPSGTEPVREWLKSLTKEERHCIGEDILSVEMRWPIGMPLVEYVSGLYVVRSTYKGNQFRVFFIVNGTEMVLLHGIFKKTEQIPEKEKKLAKKRASDT